MFSDGSIGNEGYTRGVLFVFTTHVWNIISREGDDLDIVRVTSRVLSQRVGGGLTASILYIMP